VRYKKDGQIYALKSLKKSKLKEVKHVEHTKTERKILEIIHHPFIVSLKFAFQTEKKLYIVMDCYNGGELFIHLKRRRFKEVDARFYLGQILLAIEFLHSKKIIYRDLKPENIVLDKNGYIKLTDFGLAKENIEDDSGCTQTFCGTPEYLAPEILHGFKYGKGVDLWCMGILLFEMLYGQVSTINLYLAAIL
jgi:serine/threonine protein kinase